MTVDKNMGLIFIFSLPRSGSTLLQRILASSDDISSTAEPWFLLPFCSILGHPKIESYSTYSSKLAGIALRDFVENLSEEKNTYYRALQSFGNYLYSDLAKKGSKYFLDKTPRYYLIVDELAEIFPDAKFIFLVRNPLDIFASCMSTWWKNRLWVNHQKIDLCLGPLCIKEGYEKHSSRAIKVSYESLVDSPEKTIKNIFDYLDLEYNPEVLDEFKKIGLSGTMGDKTGVIQYDRVANDSVDKWKKIINNPVRKRYVSNYLDELGEDVVNFFGFEKSKLKCQILKTKNIYSHVFSDLFWLFLSYCSRKLSLKLLFSHMKIKGNSNYTLD